MEELQLALTANRVEQRNFGLWLNSWQVGRVLQALVVDQAPSGQLLLRMGAHTVTATTDIPVQKGAVLKLEVATVQPQPTLKIIPPPSDSGNIAQKTTLELHTPALLARQGTVGNALSAVVNASSSANLLTLLNGNASTSPLQAVLKHLYQPSDLDTGAKLRAAVDRSGLFHESRQQSAQTATTSAQPKPQNNSPNSAPTAQQASPRTLPQITTPANPLVATRAAIQSKPDAALPTNGQSSQQVTPDRVNNQSLQSGAPTNAKNNAAGSTERSLIQADIKAASLTPSSLANHGKAITPGPTSTSTSASTALTSSASTLTTGQATAVISPENAADLKADLKRLLVQVRQVLQQQPVQSGVDRSREALTSLADKLDSALSGITLQQVACHSSDGKGQTCFIVDLPIQIDDQTYDLGLEIERDGSSDSKAQREEDNWRVMVRLALPQLGKVNTEMRLRMEHLSLTMYCEQASTADLMSNHLLPLQSRLEQIGFDVSVIRAHHDASTGVSSQAITRHLPIGVDERI